MGLIVALLGASAGCIALVALNGSESYLAVLLFLFGLAFVEIRRTDRKGVLAATLVFLVSLAARTADLYVCPSFPLGTHFLWHILNALAVYMLIWEYNSSRYSSSA